METAPIVSTKIQRMLFPEFGLKSCKPVRKSFLIRAMKKKRLDFPKGYATLDIERLKKGNLF